MLLASGAFIGTLPASISDLSLQTTMSITGQLAVKAPRNRNLRALAGFDLGILAWESNLITNYY